MNEDWVIVATFFGHAQAVLAKSLLEGAGLECWLQDEHISRMYPGAYGAIFGGVKLLVRPENEETARRILHRPTIVGSAESGEEP